jgi:hypothetical protein
VLVSDAVLAGVQVGDDEAVQNRLVYCNALALLDVHPGAEALAMHLLRKKAVPAKALTDTVHIAIAALHEIRFITSWNFRHTLGAVARCNIDLLWLKQTRLSPSSQHLKKFWRARNEIIRPRDARSMASQRYQCEKIGSM